MNDYKKIFININYQKILKKINLQNYQKILIENPMRFLNDII